MDKETEMKLAVAIMIISVAAFAVIVMITEPQHQSQEIGVYAEVPALGTDNPNAGCVTYVGTDEQRREQAVKNILAEKAATKNK